MKLHVPVTSAVPASLAVASISLSLLILPAGGAPARSSGVAPALKLLAGEVVAAVKAPVQAVTGSHPKTAVASPAATVGATAPVSTQSRASSARSRSVPAHRAHHGSVTRRHATTHAPVTTPVAPAAPTLTPTVTEHGNGKGKAKALGHLRKTRSTSTSVSTAVQNALQNAPGNSDHAKAHGRPTDVPQGPPAVPPGQAENGQGANRHGGSNGGGGGR